MFVALKDIVHAKGRFTLMIGVIALLTLLLVLLTGLTRGLAHQNISAIEALPADRIVLTPTLGDDISWSDSQVDTDQAAIWDDTSGIETEPRSEEHTSELQSRGHLVCRLLLEKKKVTVKTHTPNTENITSTQ